MALLEYLMYACIYFVTVIIIKFIWNQRRQIKTALRNLNRDLTLCFTTLGKMLFTWMYKKFTNETIFKSLDKNAKKSPNRTCFYFEEEKWTFLQVQKLSLQVANFFQTQGYGKEDVVGVAMQNRPEVIAIWLGLSRIGVTTALINFNLRGDSLEHCVISAKCKSVIFGTEMREAFKEIWKARQQSEKPQQHVVFYELDRYLDLLYPISPKMSIPGGESQVNNNSVSSEFKAHDFAACLRVASSKPIQIRRKEDEPNFMDTFLYVFTSGTTGMPKPAKSTHSRLNVVGATCAMIKMTQNDIVYCPLPLYHTVALSGVVWALVYGIPLVIITKFSASKFWSDVHFYKVTVCMYMGELCRFIVNQPVQEELESNHTLRTMYGCGVKPEVWETFVKRFKIKRFVEAYGSTEGNCSLVNMEGTKIGAIGYMPVWMIPFYSLKIIKVDEVTGEIIRDKKTGLAIPCKDNEPGELVGKIVNFFPSLRYDGYTNQEANEKKTARDIFRKGDRYFRSGDIMTRDEDCYFYFKDRIGDTFRWKGENVSTAEVEGVILQLACMKTTVVYGVKIPGAEGRAGMAAIYDPEGNIDMQKLGEGIEKKLPFYARPVFIRCMRENPPNMTGTFKLQKFNLQKEGFDIEVVPDPIFVFNSPKKTYQPLTIDAFKQIMQGNYRF